MNIYWRPSGFPYRYTRIEHGVAWRIARWAAFVHHLLLGAFEQAFLFSHSELCGLRRGRWL
jgi:hypothetical protein